jgi:GTP-binding protein Era
MNDPAAVPTRSGVVSIVGRPNVGKSTLLNTIVGQKIAIVTPVPQTTRRQIRGVYTESRGQIVFIDTPGLHTGRDGLGRLMNQEAAATFDGVDCLVHLVDTSRRVGPEEKAVVEQIRKARCPIILGLNKIDIRKPDVQAYIGLWEEAKGSPVQEIEKFTMVALSGEKGSNVETLLEVIFANLPEGPLLYPEDTLTDYPQKLAMADIIREKLFLLLKDELPHAVGVVIEETRPVKGKTIMIKAVILVEKETQKEIVIGRQGQMLKKVGSLAREDLENLLESKVYLETHVKVKKAWRDDLRFLRETGY